MNYRDRVLLLRLLHLRDRLRQGVGIGILLECCRGRGIAGLGRRGIVVGRKVTGREWRRVVSVDCYCIVVVDCVLGRWGLG